MIGEISLGRDMAEMWLRTHSARFDHGGCGFKVLLEEEQAVRVVPNVCGTQHVCHMPREQMAMVVTGGFFPVPALEGSPECVML